MRRKVHFEGTAMVYWQPILAQSGSGNPFGGGAAMAAMGMMVFLAMLLLLVRCPTKALFLVGPMAKWELRPPSTKRGAFAFACWIYFLGTIAIVVAFGVLFARFEGPRGQDPTLAVTASLLVGTFAPVMVLESLVLIATLRCPISLLMIANCLDLLLIGAILLLWCM